MAPNTASPLKLLVPLDGSPFAEQAIPYARMLARLFPAEIRLLHVVAPAFVAQLVRADAALIGAAGDALAEGVEQDERTRAALRDHGTRYLEWLARALDADARRVVHELVYGPPAEQIVASAGRQESDIIVMATHGRGGRLRWVLGSVAARVLRLAERPVLLIRGADPAPERVAAPKRILVGLDGSPSAERALPLARRIAQAAHAELLLVQVIESAEGLFAAYADDGATGRLRERALAYLGEAAKTLGGAAGPVSTVAPVGHVAETIVTEAERRRVDLIVLGRHGLGHTPFAFLGGTVEKVSQASAVPLLVVS